MDGISKGKAWATFRRKPSGSIARVCSKYLPIRKAREEAEEDLKAYIMVQHVKRGKGGLCGPKVGINELYKMIGGMDKS